MRKAAAVGLNVTLIVHDWCAARLVPQVLVCVNCSGSVPERGRFLMDSGTLPVFVTVIGMGALATFLCSLPNAREGGATV